MRRLAAGAGKGRGGGTACGLQQAAKPQSSCGLSYSNWQILLFADNNNELVFISNSSV